MYVVKDLVPVSVNIKCEILVVILQFAEEGPTLWVESYDVFEDFRWC